MYSILIYIHIKGLGRKAFKCYYIKKPIVTSSHSPLDILLKGLGRKAFKCYYIKKPIVTSSHSPLDILLELLYDKYQKLMDHSSAVVA